MHDLTYLNHFSFHEVKYDSYHESSFPVPSKYNFIMFMQSGTAHISCEETTVTITAGEILYIPRGAKYSVKLFGEPEILFGSYAYLSFPENERKVYGVQKIPCSEHMISLITKVSKINKIDCECIGYFYLFLHEAYKLLNPIKKYSGMDILERAMSFIIKNPDCKISSVASHCNVSESGLYALFSKRAGISPAHFKLQAKLERAVNYLISTDIPIEEISALCGFSSSSYFRKKLFSVYKKTPSEIRRMGNGKILGF